MFLLGVQEEMLGCSSPPHLLALNLVTFRATNKRDARELLETPRKAPDGPAVSTSAASEGDCDPACRSSRVRLQRSSCFTSLMTGHMTAPPAVQQPSSQLPSSLTSTLNSSEEPEHTETNQRSCPSIKEAEMFLQQEHLDQQMFLQQEGLWSGVWISRCCYG